MGKYIDTPAPSLAWLEGDLMGLGVRSLEIQDFILFIWPLPCAWGGYDYLYFAEEETEVQFHTVDQPLASHAPCWTLRGVQQKDTT